MKCPFENVDILGVAATVPAQTLDLGGLGSEYGELEVANIMASTGIEALRIAPPGVTASDLCAHSAQNLLQALDIGPSEIDGIVFVSQTPDYVLPATSACLQHRLGIRKDAPAFDISHGCSGYIYGLFQATMLVSSGACQNVLLCVGDTITRYVHPGDRAVRMVFGDGGSATLVSRGTRRSFYSIYSDGSGAEQLMIRAGGARHPKSAASSLERADQDGNVRSDENLFMSGTDIMQFALREVPKVIDEVIQLNGWTKDAVGFYGLHQANKFMVNYLAKKCKIQNGLAPVSLATTGNIGSASIPLLLASIGETYPRNRMQKAVLCGFGVGLSWGACAVELDSALLLAPLTLT